MRYRIEYLEEPTEENSVCRVRNGWSDVLELAVLEAQANAGAAARSARANGFQIRDLQQDGEIIVLETFDHAPSTIH